METKKCTKCELEKEACVANFYWREDQKKWRNRCKDCINKQTASRRKSKPSVRKHKTPNKIINGHKICCRCGTNKPATKEFFGFRKGKIKSYCKPCILIFAKEYRDKNRDTINSKRKDAYPKYKPVMAKYVKNNEEKVSAKRRANKRRRYRDDVAFRLHHNISTMIRNTINKNGESWTKYLKYTIEDFKLHIESQFESWMNWKNYGSFKKKKWKDNAPKTWKWQLDHIKPQSDYPYETMEDDNFKIVWALDNLRPYSAKQNAIDGAIRIRHKNKTQK
jgi:hypothetical protein